MTKEEISTTALINQSCYVEQQFIDSCYRTNSEKYMAVWIKKAERAIHDYKQGRLEPIIEWNTVMFRRLHPGRGYIRLIKSIYEMEQIGKRPTLNELRNYLKVMYGLTGRNCETIHALVRAGFIANGKGYYVTDFGKEALKTYCCYN